MLSGLGVAKFETSCLLVFASVCAHLSLFACHCYFLYSYVSIYLLVCLSIRADVCLFVCLDVSGFLGSGPKGDKVL